MNAYDILKTIEGSQPIDERRFNQLKRDFERDYLAGKNYEERIALHRNPPELKNQVLRELNDYLQQFHQRKEMRDIDLEKNAQGYVTTKIGEIWTEDKRLKTLYNAIKNIAI